MIRNGSWLVTCVVLVCLASAGCGASGTKDGFDDGGVADASLPPDPLPDASLVPGADRCGNGIDDDHNGVIDDNCSCVPGTTQRCYTGKETTMGVGSCIAGTQTCAGGGEFGTWGDCKGSVLPSPEVCDGAKDENCDGAVDEGCDCTNGATRACGSSVGACKPGTQTCAAGRWGDCAGATPPHDEKCDGHVDDNCDGVVDEGCACVDGSTKSCGRNVGACKPGV